MKTLASVFCPALVAALPWAPAGCGGGDLPTEAQAQPAATARVQQLTPEAAVQMERALHGDVVHVVVDCCDSALVSQSVAVAWGMQAARDLPDSAPMLVEGDNRLLTTQAAQQLADAGMSQVFLVGY